MQHIISFCFALSFLFFASGHSAFAEIWTLGKEDGNYREFAPPKHDEYLRRFDNGASFRIGVSDAQKDWPAEHPGPQDTWAGKKTHPHVIHFDLAKAPTADKAYEVVLCGWPGFSSPPVFQVVLNGVQRELAMQAVDKVDPTETDHPEQTKTGTYRVVFPGKFLKEKDNSLSLEIVKGTWFIYDFVRLSEYSSDKIESFTLKTERGIFRNPNGTGGIRRLLLDFDGELLMENAKLRIAPVSRDGGIRSTEIAISPAEDGQEIAVSLPINMENCEKDIEISATLTIGQRNIQTKVTIPGERRWEVHLLHQTHLDIGYTDTQLNILETQVQSIRDALKYIEETKDYPEEAKFKFHPEGMWAIDEFLRRATDEEKSALAAAARKGYMHFDALYSQPMTGLFNDEELFELLGFALRYGQENGVNIDSAMFTDTPGQVWGVVPALAKSGIKYITMGPNRGHRIGRVYYWGDKPFYWVSPSGKDRVLCHVFSTGYAQFHRKPIGHRLSSYEIFRLLDGYQLHEGRPYEKQPLEMLYDVVGVRYGIEADNGRPNRVVSDVVKEWNETYLYPRLILSKNSDYMKSLEERYGKDFPVVRGDYTPYWEDGAASTSEATAICRDAKERLIRAETLWAISDPGRYVRQVDLFDSAWSDLLMYDEHTWGASKSISQPDLETVIVQDAFKQAYARRGHEKTLKLESEFSFDATTVAKSATPTAGKSYVDAENGTIGNDLISLKIDKSSGAIVSFKRKGIEEDLVDVGSDGNSGLNDYLYIIGRDPQKNRERISSDVEMKAKKEAGSSTLEIISTAPNCKSMTRTITIYDDRDDVTIVNTLDKIRERRQEGTFFGFPFNVPGGVWRYDMPWATALVEKEQLPGGNRNFYCVQRLCNLSNDQYGIDWVTIDAPMVQFSPILFTIAWPRDLRPWRDHIDPGGTVYSWVCNNHWETNYKADQEGILKFTYKIRPYLGKYNPAASQHFARGTAEDHLTSRLMEVDNDNIVVTRIKAARTKGIRENSSYGQGLFVRMYNPTEQPQTFHLRFFTAGEKKDDYAAEVYHSNSLEDRIGKSGSTLTIAPYDIMMLRVE